MRPDAVAGAILPDGELSDHPETHRMHSELQQGDSSRDSHWLIGRATVEELRLNLRAVRQPCCPDWDISSAEQRAAWAKGDQANFHPYGKRRRSSSPNRT
jgi:hypothetical protein